VENIDLPGGYWAMLKRSSMEKHSSLFVVRVIEDEKGFYEIGAEKSLFNKLKTCPSSIFENTFFS
jgi:hypothetical protein